MNAINDCQRCKMQNTAQIRQTLGCGFEPPAPPDVHVVAWQPAGFTGDDLVHCPGYTSKLNEVVEATWARMYLHKGELSQWCGGAPASETLLRTVEAYEVACAAVEQHEAAERAAAAGR